MAAPNTAKLMDSYLEGVYNSSKRSRIAMITLIVSCILSIISVWNSDKNSWPKELNKVANIINENFVFSDQKLSDEKNAILESGMQKEYEENLLRKKTYCIGIKSPIFNSESTYCLPLQARVIIPTHIYYSNRSYNEKLEILMSDKRLNDLKLAVGFISARDIQTNIGLKDNAETIYSESIKKRFIDIPFFGAWFYINDLGLISGISLFVILFMLRFSLSRELQNIRLIFDETDEVESLKMYYNLIAMRQVFISPDILSAQKPSGLDKLWKFTPMIILLLPAIVYTVVLYHDYNTFDLGYTNSVTRALSAFRLELIFSLVIIGTTIACFRLWIRMQQEFKLTYGLITNYYAQIENE